MASPRRYEAEIATIEDALAIAGEALDVLAVLARNCETTSARRRVAARIAALERRVLSLQARRRQIQQELAENRGKS